MERTADLHKAHSQNDFWGCSEAWKACMEQCVASSGRKIALKLCHTDTINSVLKLLSFFNSHISCHSQACIIRALQK
jgi:hypothetical protein